MNGRAPAPPTPAPAAAARETLEHEILGRVDRVGGVKDGALNVADRARRRSPNARSNRMQYNALRLPNRLRRRHPNGFAQQAHDTVPTPIGVNRPFPASTANDHYSSALRASRFALRASRF